MLSSNAKIEHIIEIQAPIEKVWSVLIDINDWKWNKWTRLEADKVEEGVKGKLLASFEGDGKWKEYDFTFGAVDSDKKSLSWYGSIGPSGCLFHGYHTMRLEDSEGDTKLIHTENFSGILPRFKLGLPYEKLNRNYLLMNKALKAYVE